MRKAGESWRGLYRRLSLDRAWRRRRDKAIPKALCEVCRTLTAEVHFHVRNMRTIHYTLCSVCGHLEVVEDEHGDIPGMGPPSAS